MEVVEGSRRSINHEDLRLSFLSKGIEIYGDYIDFLIRHERPSDALNQAELSRARTLAEGLASTSETTSQASRAVLPQQIVKNVKGPVLSYWIGQKTSYLWVIAPAKTSNFKLAPPSQIEPVAAEYQTAL